MIYSAPPMPRIVVLAAGFSTRLGKPKALATIRGASLLSRTLRVLAPFARSSTVVVVIPARSNRYRIGPDERLATFVVNRQRAAGLSSSVRCGISRVRYSAAVLLLPVDLAQLQARDIARLISRWRGARRRVAARRVHDKAAAPLILPRSFYSRALGITGDQGLRDLVRQLAPGQVSLVPLPSAAADIDTPQDLKRARRRARPRPS
jgi:molybdenum cofactor cytidylyltransferase